MPAKTRLRHPDIAKLMRDNRWRMVKIRAKNSSGTLAIAAADALFYTGRFDDLNTAIIHRLDDPALRTSEESNAIIKHILERFVELQPSRIYEALKSVTLQRVGASSELNGHLCSLLRTNGMMK